MKRMQIFRAGRQTASNGATLDFGEAQLKQTVEAYDPALHEAPIVVGHPRDNLPAYGWVSGLSFSEDGHLQADVSQLEPQFAEMVKAGRFKKRSASFYRPDSPNNPVPGVYYLRHVGFLGAAAPAVKGLKDPEFNDSADDVVEFADAMVVSTLFRRMREFFIERFGSEDTDKVLPSWLIEDLEAEARNDSASDVPASDFTDETPPAAPQTPPSDNAPGDNTPPPEDSTMTEQEAQELRDRATAAETELATYKAKEASFAEREAKLRRQEIADQVDTLIKDGRVLPANREATIDYAASLDDSNEVDFSDGEGKDPAKRTQLGRYLDLLAKQPKAVDFNEHSNDDGTGGEQIDFTEQAQRAQAWKEKRRDAGVHISTAQAIRDVQAGRDK